MRSVLTVGLVLSLALVFVGCAQPPEEEINAAQAALDGAKKAEADIYAPEAYAAAKQSLDDSRSKVEQEDYEGAKASALRAKEQADQAKSLADAAKPKVRDEAQALVARLTPVLSDTKSAAGNAPQGKGADEDLDQLRSDLGQAEASLSSAQNSLAAGKFKDALDQAKSADGKLSQVQASLQTAMKKIADWQEENKPWFERM